MNSSSTSCPRRYLLLTLLALFALCGSQAQVRAMPPKAILSRQNFVNRARRIKPEGMTEAQIEAILGKPDLVGTFNVEYMHTAWFYGCSGPHRLPLLGTVLFDTKGHCHSVSGTQMPPTNVISEAQLRQAMLLLDQAPCLSQTDTGAWIRTVNALIPFGKAKILAAMKEYRIVISSEFRPDMSREWKISPATKPSSREALYMASKLGDFDETSLLFLVRILFDIPAKPNAPCGDTLPFPYTAIGLMEPGLPTYPAQSPRYPVLLIDDIPLLEIDGVQLAGMPESIVQELPFLEKKARLRTRPLRPTAHLEKVLADMEASPQWFSDQAGPISPDTRHSGSPFPWKAVRTHIKEQVLTLLAPLYPTVVKFERFGNTGINASGIKVDTWQWDAIMADLKKHPVRWNPTTEEYERLDPKAAPIGK